MPTTLSLSEPEADVPWSSGLHRRSKRFALSCTPDMAVGDYISPSCGGTGRRRVPGLSGAPCRACDGIPVV